MIPFLPNPIRSSCRMLSTCCLLGWVAGTAALAEEPAETVLVPGADKQSFDFETEEMKGTIRLDGSYHGVTRLTDKRSGRQVIDPRYSALNLFRLMSVNQAMDKPRTMTRTTHVSSNWVEARWAARESHKADLTARYEVASANAVDLTVTVRAVGAYPGYELFLSNYFDKALRPYVYLKPRGKGAPERVLPRFNDVFRETVIVFPRDGHSARHCVDGRWDHGEAVSPVVQMCPVRHYGYCLAWLADEEKQVGTVLMSHPRHTYAISTRYFVEKPENQFTTYSAFDFSLFGGDLTPGETRVVKVRLALTPLDEEMTQPLAMYREYVAEMEKESKLTESKDTSP